MRWDMIYSAALLVGVLNESSAFMWPRRHHDTSMLYTSNLGWDNENFLESLGKGPDAIDEANAEYERLKKFGTPEPDGIPASSAPGAELSKEQIEKIKQTNEEDTSEGGQMFKKLMERAEKGEVRRPPPSLQAPPPPLPTTAPENAAPEGAPALPAGFENLSVEAQAALFRELMKSPQVAVPQQEAPTGQYREKGLAADGRRIGRNRDADAVVNTSDVYFAQLKLDSRVRNTARYVGDQEKADSVFADPGIKDIKLHINPYMEEQRQKERDMLETAPDEMIRPGMYEDKPLDKTDAGMSYKERLQARRAGKKGVATPLAVKQEPAPKPPTEPIQTRPSPPVAQQETVSPSPAQSTPEPKATIAPPTPEPKPTAPKTPEETHKDIRTLMGLLLKHRGGPGFGAGRIKGEEIAKFDELAESIMETIEAEPFAPPEAEPVELKIAADSPVQSSAPVTAVPNVASSAIETKPRVPAGDRINSMMNCIDGAIVMYKNSPPELKDSVLVTLRAALLSAVNTCNDLVGDNDTTDYSQIKSTPSDAPAAERITSMLSCIDGAIQMFKNSPPELQGNIFLTLRAALLSAVGTCNALIAEGELQTFTAAGGPAPTFTQTAETAPTTPPAQFTDVVPEASAVASPVTESSVIHEQAPIPDAPPVYNGNDENSAVLEKIYDKIQAASGNGKMGLKPDMSAQEAEDLADSIAEMRSLLVEELQTGIPQNPSSSRQSAPAPESTTSIYQDMLAQARAEKKKGQ